MRLLIISMRAGAGHVKAAAALEAAARNSFPDWDVRNIDLFDYSTPLLGIAYGELYLKMVRSFPSLYRFLYNHYNGKKTKAHLLVEQFNSQPLKELLQEFRPDWVICTNFVPIGLVSYWREKLNIPFKLAVTVTDYTAHPIWHDPNVDYYAVAHQAVGEMLHGYEVPREQIHAVGIPISPAFSDRPDYVKARKTLSIPNKPTILLMAGGFGIGPIVRILEGLLASKSSLNILAVAGNNAQLEQQLKDIKVPNHHHVVVFGYTNTIETCMAAADLLVTKPGGLTVSEALAYALPMVLVEPIPGQEEANARFIVENSAGWQPADTDEVVPLILSLLKDKDQILMARRQAYKLGKPDAATAIINDIASYNFT